MNGDKGLKVAHGVSSYKFKFRFILEHTEMHHTLVTSGANQSSSIRHVTRQTLQRHVAGMVGNMPDGIEHDNGLSPCCIHLRVNAARWPQPLTCIPCIKIQC